MGCKCLKAIFQHKHSFKQEINDDNLQSDFQSIVSEKMTVSSRSHKDGLFASNHSNKFNELN
jgi:hypothetical protein